MTQPTPVPDEPSAIHEANRACWNAAIEWWQAREDARGLWKRSHEDPTLVLSPSEMPFVRDLKGKRACVLGSGDNEVVFALCGLGAAVTSVDISERRLAVAAERAATLGLTVTFVRADVIDLSALEDNTFDLVYTGGHVAVWVSDIRQYYAEAVRILKAGGIFLVNEYHPIRRMWSDSETTLPSHRYFDRGPHSYQTDEGLPAYEYHWTVADHIQAVLDAGCTICKVDEFGEDLDEMTPSALRTLPTYLLIAGRKSGAG